MLRQTSMIINQNTWDHFWKRARHARDISPQLREALDFYLDIVASTRDRLANRFTADELYMIIAGITALPRDSSLELYQKNLLSSVKRTAPIWAVDAGQIGAKISNLTKVEILALIDCALEFVYNRKNETLIETTEPHNPDADGALIALKAIGASTVKP